MLIKYKHRAAFVWHITHDKKFTTRNDVVAR